MKTIDGNANWFENRQKYESKSKRMNIEKMKNELYFTNQEIKRRRKIRLADLYSFESLK
jgi:hypothetical protein